ncbi:MAG: F0F1 ATP synthase subunit epsilon [Promicromonosporaceae bacterium]|nr:F0F1 ATP synthase subunit epsilon [Promicromonosporaceae bacterium]
MAQLEVDVVATDRQAWSGTAVSVSAPSVAGQIGILPGHTPLLAVLGKGTVRVLTGQGEPFEVEISGGFLSVDENLVTVVADEVTAKG